MKLLYSGDEPLIVCDAHVVAEPGRVISVPDEIGEQLLERPGFEPAPKPKPPKED